MTAFMTWANNVLLVVGWLAGGVFIVWYTKRFGWWRDEFAAHLASFSLVVEAFYSLFIVRPWVPPVAFAWARLGLFTLLTAVVVWRLVVFVRSFFRDAARFRAKA
jgi:hypothetical protein